MLCGFFLLKRTFNPKLEILNLFGGSLSVGLSPTFSTPCGFILAFFFTFKNLWVEFKN